MNLLHSSSIFFWYCNALDRITGKEELSSISIGLYLKQQIETIGMDCWADGTLLMLCHQHYTTAKNMINQLFLLLAVNVFDFLSSVCVFNSMYTSTKKKPNYHTRQYFFSNTSSARQVASILKNLDLQETKKHNYFQSTIILLIYRPNASIESIVELGNRHDR